MASPAVERDLGVVVQPPSQPSVISTTTLSLILHFLQPRREIPVAARLSRQWYAAACSPLTWRGSVSYTVHSKGVHVHGLCMTFSSADEMRLAAASAVFCNLACVAFDNLDLCVEERADRDRARLQALRRFRRILSLTWRVTSECADLWADLFASEAMAQLQHLLAPVNALRHLVNQVFLPRTDGSDAAATDVAAASANAALPSPLQQQASAIYTPAPCAATILHLHEQHHGGADGSAVKALAAFIVQAPRLQTVSDIGSWPFKFPLVRELSQLGFPRSSDLVMMSPDYRTTSRFAWWPPEWKDLPAGDEVEPVLWRRSLHLTHFPCTSQRTVFQRLFRVFPHLVELELQEDHVGPRNVSYVGTNMMETNEEWRWGSMDEPPCQLRSLRFPSEHSTMELSLHGVRWFRHAGALFSGLTTLQLHARRTVDTEWAEDFRRLPHLSDLTMMGLILTTCEPFAQLKNLKRLRDVMWPLDSARTNERFGTPAARAAHFPRLIDLGMHSVAIDLYSLQAIGQTRPFVTPALFPTKSVLSFIQALPCDLHEVEIRTHDAPVKRIQSLVELEKHIAKQEAIEHASEAVFSAQQQSFVPGTSSVRFRPVHETLTILDERGASFEDVVDYQCITAMRIYEGYSLEELRLIDRGLVDEIEPEVLHAWLALCDSWRDPIHRLCGLWRRASIHRSNGVVDLTTQVYWFQSAKYHIDLRVPIDRPRVSAWEYLTADDQKRFAGQLAFAGVTVFDGRRCEWHPSIAFPHVSSELDAGLIEFQDADRFTETALDGSYVEKWYREKGGAGEEGGQGEMLGFKLMEVGGGSQLAYLLINEQWMAWACGRATDRFDAASFNQQSPCTEFRVYQRCGSEWICLESNLPWRNSSFSVTCLEDVRQWQVGQTIQTSLLPGCEWRVVADDAVASSSSSSSQASATSEQSSA